MSFANIIGSVVCVAALSADSFSNQSIQHIQAPSAQQSILQQESLSYASLCGSVLSSNTLFFRLLANRQEYIDDLKSREILQSFIAKLDNVCTIANERMQQSGAFKPFDEDVFFSSLALKTLIENLLDEDFMENVGANPSLQDVEIVAFGRGIAEAARDFENAAS